MRNTTGQLSFDSLPFGDVLPESPKTDAPGLRRTGDLENERPKVRLETAVDDDVDDDDLGRPRPPCAKAFETWLRHLGFPFVAVDEAKKVIFSGVAVDSFDVLVYSQSGPNLLVLLEPSPSQADVDAMTEWEKTFGTGFRAVFAWNKDGEWVAVALADWTGNPAHARPLRDMI